MIRQLKRHCFTFIELLVVVSLLSIAALAVGVKIKQLYDEQQLLNEVQDVVHILRTAQDLMQLANQDNSVVFSKLHDGHISYYIKPNNNVGTKWQPLIESKKNLKFIKYVDFNGFSVKSNDETEIKFFSRGWNMSPGKLVLAPDSHIQEGRKDIYQISLTGQPGKIKSQRYVNESPSLYDAPKNEQELYPKQAFEEP